MMNATISFYVKSTRCKCAELIEEYQVEVTNRCPIDLNSRSTDTQASFSSFQRLPFAGLLIHEGKAPMKSVAFYCIGNSRMYYHTNQWDKWDHARHASDQ